MVNDVVLSVSPTGLFIVAIAFVLRGSEGWIRRVIDLGGGALWMAVQRHHATPPAA
jgi:hypothetical protein